MNGLTSRQAGCAGNHIMPFLWMHGEEESVLREEIAQIARCGIGAFCVESRPHPDFAGPLWWRDLDIVMDEAKKRDMRVWVLDDKSFPTGTAAGTAASAPLNKRKMFLDYRRTDAIGPLKGASIPFPPGVTDELVAVTVRRLDGQDGYEDLTCRVDEDSVYWDIPEGAFRVYFFYIRHDSPCGTNDHLNPLNRAGTRLLIDAVYEPHYERYKKDFGKTFAGFFSDEPGFYTSFTYDLIIGDHGLVLPWDYSMGELLEQKTGALLCRILPALFDDAGDTAFFRYTYMDAVTALYRDCFCYELGNWCRERGVEYMGHIIEDNNSHARLGVSAGHYFRSLEGQDYAGIDIVLHQILPGMPFDHTGISGFAANALSDGEFYHNALAQLAASHAQLDPKKKGRAMCEIFGAFGWSEGNRMMKWMTDFMLCRGINTFVPHAFSPREFPDPDCPPHFYAHGQNPMFDGFALLMRYMNRLSELLSGGRQAVDAAILYHGEAEWTADGRMLCQKPARELAASYMEYLFVWADLLESPLVVEKGVWLINGQSFSVLLVPYIQAVPLSLLKGLEALAKAGLPVAFVGGYPERILVGADDSRPFAQDVLFDVVDLKDAASYCREYSVGNKPEITVTGGDGLFLRRYTYETPDSRAVYMFVNEHPRTAITARAGFGSGSIAEYDAFNNKLYDAGGTAEFILAPTQSRIFITGLTGETALPTRPELPFQAAVRGNGWQASLCPAGESEFKEYAVLDELVNLNVPGKLSHFSGTLRYSLDFDWEIQFTQAQLDLGEVFETARVQLNGHDAGTVISPPYVFDISQSLCRGENRLEIEICNPLGHRERDHFSRFMVMEPIGLLGPAKIEYN